jgi:uncharacterized RDD family membrane protein YckC
MSSIAPEAPDAGASMHDIATHAGDNLLLRRWIGCWIDLIVACGCLLAPDWLLGNALYQSTVAVWLLLAVGYFVVGERAWGRTLGKLITGTIVVNVHGARPNLVQVLTRTLMRLFEVNPLLMGGVPAGIAVSMSTNKQRLGDMMANTYVVSVRTLRNVQARTAPSAA